MKLLLVHFRQARLLPSAPAHATVSVVCLVQSNSMLHVAAVSTPVYTACMLAIINCSAPSSHTGCAGYVSFIIVGLELMQ